MDFVINALTPVLGLILTGFLIQRFNFLPSSFWGGAEKLTYFVLFPATLISSLSSKEIGQLPWFRIMLTVEGAVIISALAALIWKKFARGMNGAVFTSLFQGGVRFNTFVALALADSMYGSEGLFIAAIGAGFMIILINILCVSVFSVTIKGLESVSVGKVLTDLAKNPLIISCIIGVGMNLSGYRAVHPVSGYLSLLGKAAFPLGLMAVGAAYRGENIMLHKHPLFVSSGIQFMLKPATAFALAAITGLNGTAAAVAVILFSVPTAPSAYILSRQMGGDHDSMAAIITAQTVLSFITLPITVIILKKFIF